MAVLPPNNDVLKAVIFCILKILRAEIGSTDAKQITENVFNNNFELCIDYNKAQLKTNLKLFLELQVN